MKKRILSFVAVMILTLSVCMTAFAEGETSVTPPVQEHTGTAAGLKSYGRIVYQKGTESVKIDSDDLYMLADQIDQVKLQVTDQLEAMNTYFTAGEGEIALETSDDISVVHAKPFEEDFVDPVDVNFDTLLEGIAVSQSVSTDTAAYGYPAGTELYKDEKGVLTTNGSGAGTEKITVTAATADNLSAGTAAWVNGSLILGTGEDNKSYYDQGTNNSNVIFGSTAVYGAGNSVTVNLGKRPKFVVLFTYINQVGWTYNTLQICDDVSYNNYCFNTALGKGTEHKFGSTDITITDTGFKYIQRFGSPGDSLFGGVPLYYYAVL